MGTLLESIRMTRTDAKLHFEQVRLKGVLKIVKRPSLPKEAKQGSNRHGCLPTKTDEAEVHRVAEDIRLPIEHCWGFEALIFSMTESQPRARHLPTCRSGQGELR
jgi:hypothetical protein